MIEPTTGRVVWYHHTHEEPPFPRLGDQPYAAHVAFVHSDRLVNLLVIAHDGHVYPVQNVLLLQDDDAAPADKAYAEWMPYQKGQAARTDQTAGQASADLTARIDALEASTTQRFHETGDYIEKALAAHVQRPADLGGGAAPNPAPPPDHPPPQPEAAPQTA